MKKVISLVVAGVVLLAQSGIAATTATYKLTATIPASTAVAINAFSITTGNNPVKTAVAGTTLDLGPLVYNVANGIYLPDHFYVIESGLTSGAGTQSVTVAYTEGLNPNSGTTKGALGTKANVAFNMVTGPTTEVAVPGHAKKLLKNIISTPESLTAAELGSNLLKIYIGINTGDASMPAGGEVISNLDKAGAYDGTLVVTATVV